MGHIRLLNLPQSKKWQEVVNLLDSDADLNAVAEATSKASERDLARASDDPNFQFISQILVELPIRARAPDFEQYLQNLGIGKDALTSVPNLHRK